MLRTLVVMTLLWAVGAENTVTIQTHWAGGFNGKFGIDFTEEMSGWTAHLKFDQPVTTLQTWVADAAQMGDGREWALTSKPFNADEHPGDHVCVDFQGQGAGDINPKATVTVESSAGANPTVIHTGGGKELYNYSQSLGLSILFYNAQRSGKLPADNPIPWRGDSALGDKGDDGHDLTGGWYDAGDHVKFNLPMAASTLVLLWGLDRWRDGYQHAGQLDKMYDMIKWPLDYFLKCWIPDKMEYYFQVGDGNNDHHFWGRAEDMTMARPAYKLTDGQAGSDVEGETAAAFAAGSIVFKEKDAAYSAKLLDAAKSLYEFAKKNPGIYTAGNNVAGQFYSSSDWKDEMCEAAAWLYKATKDEKYLEEAKTYVESAWAWALSWDDKKVACQLLLYELTKSATYKDEVVGYMKGWLPGGATTYTPCGLAWRDMWGSLRYAGNTAFVALLAAEDGLDTLTYRKWAIGQMNYILGQNNKCISYQIGFGSKYPLSPHHRSASCPDRPSPCTQANLHSSQPSPQLLKGAIVGGPDATDAYTDNREDYIHNEVACDYNSGFQSALAGLVHLAATDNLPPGYAPTCSCPL